MEYLPTILLILIAFIVVAIYFKKNRSNNDSSQELLIQLNESLRKEIQDIRKEIGDNAEKGRQEIENKLKDINLFTLTEYQRGVDLNQATVFKTYKRNLSSRILQKNEKESC